ncbi:hydrogenase expression/formation protein HypE [Kibdelosporangium aridum]|uniref:Hydrogenase expression/formation protein HypE n=1 Tax=Kibdelosporangium aridum TaxID=2030 RepID=A0A428ZAV2_KIBAR|nr:hydrogenase expression/formation protein HypE [Kibdelosporangium aridum]RSM85207.1 hydrogenase expression/formation protein HypE [Kibdelosporangium aridum]
MTPVCPVPHTDLDVVLLGHGSGGRLMAELIDDVIAGPLGMTGPLEDACVLATGSPEVVVSTDSFVVTPRFFPGGDIGSLAVHGTVNDVAMRGAQPLALALSYILEEGLPMADLRQITASVAMAAADADVRIVTGDTKVVNRGAADGVYITTTGIGVRLPGARAGASGARPGDVVLVSGPIGGHGTAILSARERLGLSGDLVSDSRPLHRVVRAMIETAGPAVHALRDPTRGGLAAALNELAHASSVAIEIEESDVPVREPVASACELLGLDPWHMANEGCLIAMVDPSMETEVLTAVQALPESQNACRIGQVTAGPPGLVTARTMIGSARVVDVPVGEQLPRIC